MRRKTRERTTFGLLFVFSVAAFVGCSVTWLSTSSSVSKQESSSSQAPSNASSSSIALSSVSSEVSSENSSSSATSSSLPPGQKTAEKTIKVYRFFNCENEYLDPVLDEQKLTYEGVEDGARAGAPLRYYEYYDMDAMSKAIDSIRYSFPKFYKKTAIFINLLLFFFRKA